METIGLATQAEFVLRARQVYVEVALAPKPVANTLADPGIGVRSLTVGRRATLATFLKQGRVLAVLGATGSGKTTMARYTALEMAERRPAPWRPEFWQPRRIPVLLYLRDHKQAILGKEGLADVAISAPCLKGVVPASWLERRLDRGRCVVLLDGLDEVADRARVVQWVQDQVARYPGNTFVVTSRPLGYDGNRLATADVLQVQRFTSGQIHQFLRAWYHTIEHRAREGDRHEIDDHARASADDLLQRIIRQPALFDLAANPLLLTMIANVHRYRGSLPGSRADLYGEMCQVLLHRRQEAKNLPDIDLPGVTSSRKERIVQELAWYMMRHQLRDIPSARAEQAVRATLARTAPGVSFQVLLDHICRSGLLLESQPGSYGFAHLTLQEYLAAAMTADNHARRQVLIEHVGDPWWRETILLWAARNDATTIVEACLTARTTATLSLAYACADEARELDHALRDQLTQLLTTTPTDLNETRLLDSVAAARALHDTLRLEAGTTICIQPVSRDLWNRYAERTSPHPSKQEPGSDPARGLWAGDVTDFLTWLNSLFDDGTIYRIPTPAEIKHPDLQTMLVSINGTIWTGEAAGLLHLHQPGGIPHPHIPTSSLRASYPRLVLSHTYLLFRLATSAGVPLHQLLLYGYLANADLPASPALHLIRTLDLTTTLEAAITLNRALALDLARDFDRNLALGLDFERDRALALAHDRDLALDPDLDLDFDRALGLDLDSERALDLTLDRALDLTLDRALACANELARDLDLDLARDFDRGFARDRDFARAVNLALDFDRDLASARSRGLDFAVDLTLDHALAAGSTLDTAPGGDYAQDVALARTLDRCCVLDHSGNLDRPGTRTHALARDLDRLVDRVDTLDLAPNLTFRLVPHLARNLAFASDHAVDLSRALAFARLLRSGNNPLGQAATYAGVSLLRAWVDQRRDKGGWPTPSSLSLEKFLADALKVCGDAPPADDIPGALHQALDQLQRRPLDDPWTITLLSQALKLAGAVRSSLSPSAQGDLVLAAALVLAALLRISPSGSGLSFGPDEALIRILQGALMTLVALTDPRNANQTVLLVKV